MIPQPPEVARLARNPTEAPSPAKTIASNEPVEPPDEISMIGVHAPTRIAQSHGRVPPIAAATAATEISKTAVTPVSSYPGRESM
jgi:hypothetical protein